MPTRPIYQPRTYRPPAYELTVVPMQPEEVAHYTPTSMLLKREAYKALAPTKVRQSVLSLWYNLEDPARVQREMTALSDTEATQLFAFSIQGAVMSALGMVSVKAQNSRTGTGECHIIEQAIKRPQNQTRDFLIHAALTPYPDDAAVLLYMPPIANHETDLHDLGFQKAGQADPKLYSPAQHWCADIYQADRVDQIRQGLADRHPAIATAQNATAPPVD